MGIPVSTAAPSRPPRENSSVTIPTVAGPEPQVVNGHVLETTLIRGDGLGRQVQALRCRGCGQLATNPKIFDQPRAPCNPPARDLPSL